MRSMVSILFILILASCLETGNNPNKGSKVISGDIIIFHAGSLSFPFQKVARAFEQENPGVKVLLESSGSVDCARKITDLQKPCDLMASSDYKVIENMLMPGFTSWYLPFAGNEMVIAFAEKSLKQDIISKTNWYEILLAQDVRYGRADPDADPCGYRSLMVMQLAGIYYGQPRLTEMLSSKDMKYIRPKEVDLLALLEVRETDYIFIYKSVAIQHGLKYLELPDEINLKNVEFDEHYRQAVVSIKGKTPENSLEVKGETITYAITLLDKSPNPKAAQAFLEFLLARDKGLKILQEAGHNSLIPAKIPEGIILPGYLQKFTQP